MAIKFWDLVTYSACPHAYQISRRRYSRQILRAWKDRRDDVRRTIAIYHDPANEDDPQAAAMTFFYDRFEQLPNKLYENVYEPLFSYLPKYFRLVHPFPYGIVSTPITMSFPVKSHAVTLTLDYTTVTPVNHNEAWVLRFSDVPPEPSGWASSFIGKLACAILQHSAPGFQAMGVFYLKAGVLQRLDVSSVPQDPSFPEQLTSLVDRLQTDQSFPLTPGQHCKACYHRLNGNCRGVLAG